MMNDYECPYCQAPHEYDGDGMGDGDTEEVQCDKCEKFFLIVGCITVSYDAYQADCLNGAPHAWAACLRYPRVMYGKVQYRCSGCQITEDRPATPEEIAKHGDWPTMDAKVVA
jgi:hypothetical protein